jgi:hypothetical protein
MIPFLRAVGYASLPLAFATGLATPASAQNVISQNTTLRSHLCIGAACVDSEAYGDDGLRLKTTNIRINFADSSTSGSGFPGNDWRILINDVISGTYGGQNYFAIEDSDAATVPFRVAAGAPTSTLVIGAGGNVGFGTALPQSRLHIVAPNTPTIRLDQSGGFYAPYNWDILGNEQGFALRDTTGGGALVMRFVPGAATNALTVGPNGVGVGVLIAQSALHLRRSDGTARLLVEETSPTATPRTLLELKNNGRPELVLANTDTGGEWSFGAGTNFVLKQGAVGSASSAKTKLFEIDAAGNATLTGTLVTGGPSCAGGCDAVFAPDYPLPSIAEHAARMYELGHLPNIGPTVAGAPFDVTETLGRLLNEVEHAHIYIAQLEGRERRQQAVNAGYEARIDALEARLAQLAAVAPARD